MTVDWWGLVGLLGPLAVVVALVVLGLLSRRLGSVTRAPRYYIGFYLSALLMALSILARVLNVGHGAENAAALEAYPLWVFLYVGLPVIAVTLSTVIAWRYWSWLLAERS